MTVDAPTPRAGYRSTEFWLSLLVTIPGILVMAGVVPSSDEPNLETLATKMAAGLAASIAVWRYVASRTQLKDVK